jgi:hypothetical protein
MFSWVELLIARTLTTTDAKPIAAIMTRTVSASGLDWGVLAAAGVLTIIPGALVIWFVRNVIAKGFALGRYDDQIPHAHFPRRHRPSRTAWPGRAGYGRSDEGRCARLGGSLDPGNWMAWTFRPRCFSW